MKCLGAELIKCTRVTLTSRALTARGKQAINADKNRQKQPSRHGEFQESFGWKKKRGYLDPSIETAGRAGSPHINVLIITDKQKAYWVWRQTKVNNSISPNHQTKNKWETKSRSHTVNDV